MSNEVTYWTLLQAYLEIFVDHQVFIFDIPVRYANTVQIMDSFDDLRENIASLIFGEAFVLRLFDTFKEIMGRTTEKYRAYSGVEFRAKGGYVEPSR